MKPITYEDLYEFNFLSDPRLAPDGKHAIFTRQRADKEKNGYTSDIWLLDMNTKEYRPLTTGGGERGAFWLDNETVAFVANRGKKSEKPQTTWYTISIKGGEAGSWLTVPEQAGGLKLIDKDTYLYTTVRQADGEEEKQENKAVLGKDFFVFDEFPFWFNGRKVINKKRNTLKLHQNGETKTLSPQYLDVMGVQLSPDKTKIVYGGCEYQDVLSRTSGLYLYDLVSGETKTLVEQGSIAVGSPFFMGDNEIFYTGLADDRRGDNPEYYIYNLNTGESRRLPFPDAAPHGGIGTDANMGGGIGMKYVDGYLYFLQTVWSQANLVRMDHDGHIETVCATPGAMTAFDMAEGNVIFTAMRGNNLVEVYQLTEQGEVQLTGLNKPYMENHSTVTPEYFTFENRAGVTLEGFVLKPLHFEPGKKYPGILEMHGGPKVAFGSIFHHEMQCFAAQDYFVFFTNPRGSDGRGDAFAKINGLLGTIDYDDFMDFTDEVIKRYPELDENHIGICGGSYGGYMCNWMIGHTDRYAAAASQRSISNYFTKLLCTDIGITYDLPQAGGDPWDDYDQVWEISPLKYAPNAKTPTLFIQSDEDYRCWMSGAVQMFNALQQNGVPSRIALFHEETHELSRSGRPTNRISRLSEIGDWFAKYLQEPVKNSCI